MSEMFNPHAPATAYDHNTTIVAVLELSGKNWLLGVVAPGVSVRMKRSIEARNLEAVVRALEQAKEKSAKAGFEVARIVVGFESGRDGFWIARALRQRGLEVYVMHAASIAVEQRGKRAKTDRLDVDLLLTTLMGWLRGEPGRCTMAPVPSEEEEDLREAGRRRETLVHARLRVENQISSLLIRQGIKGFKPRLKNAEKKLGELRTFDGRPLPVNMMNSLKLLLAQHRLLSAQLKAIEEARQRVVTIADPDRLQRMIQALAGVVGVGVETATVLVHEVVLQGPAGCGRFRRADRHALQQRRFEDRARDQQERQRARPSDVEPTGVAVARASARQRACAMVQGAPWRRQRAHEEGPDRRAHA